jgi:putative redox protein
MYSNHKKWELDEIIVHLSHSRDYAEDCEHCEEKGTKMEVIERGLEVYGNLDQKQRDRLIEIANKCPVHKLLEGGLTIHTFLVEKNG